MHIDQENWEGGNHPDNSPMEGVDDFWDPDTWGPWSQGVDAALNQLHHDLRECIQKVPQSEQSFHNFRRICWTSVRKHSVLLNSSFMKTTMTLESSQMASSVHLKMNFKFFHAFS